jgi:hypothetical protein
MADKGSEFSLSRDGFLPENATMQLATPLLEVVSDQVVQEKKFASLSTTGIDTLEFLNFSVSDIDNIGDVIRRIWIKGIQREKTLPDGWQFKLRGNPGFASPLWDDNKRLGTILISSLLQELSQLGWFASAGTGTGKMTLVLYKTFAKSIRINSSSTLSRSASSRSIHEHIDDKRRFI